MSLKFHWMLPSAGDSRYLLGGAHTIVVDRLGRGVDQASHRVATLDYLIEVGRTLDRLGYEAILVTTGTNCEDAWLTATALAGHTSRLKFLVAVRTSVISPVLTAHMGTTFQRFSGNRLLLNIVTGSTGAEAQRFGDHLDKAGQYRRTEEFMAVLRGVWAGEPFDFVGEHFDIRGAVLNRNGRLPQQVPPLPELYFTGSSEPAAGVAGRQSDVYLTWGEPRRLLVDKIDRIRTEADRAGRQLRFGLRVHVIARDSADEAWRQAGRLLDQLTPDAVAEASALIQARASVGSQRARAALAGPSGASAGAVPYVVEPNLWAGIGLVTSASPLALVGSHEELADRLSEYADLGITEFILSGFPNPEEAQWFGEGVLPILRRSGLLDAPAAQPADPIPALVSAGR